MKLFLSWSGVDSRKVAFALYQWFPQVINAIDPYMSSESIDKGARWNDHINALLSELHAGIICLTPFNLESPWINFEAGALAKSVENSRVIPFLVGVNKADLNWPLAQFQASSCSREDIQRMLFSINRIGKETALREDVLLKSFDRWWPDLEVLLSEIEQGLEGTEKKGSETVIMDSPTMADKIDELLVLVRELSQQNTAAQAEVARIIRQVDPSEPGMTLLGKQVFHPKFGSGLVQEVLRRKNDEELVIDFQRHGEKRLLRSLAKLDVLE